MSSWYPVIGFPYVLISDEGIVKRISPDKRFHRPRTLKNFTDRLEYVTPKENISHAIRLGLRDRCLGGVLWRKKKLQSEKKTG